MSAARWRGFTVEDSADGVTTLTLTGGRALNALTAGLKRDLVEYLRQAQNDDAVRVLLITGEGRVFCAGDDVSGGYYADDQAPTQVPSLPPAGAEPVRLYASLRSISQALTQAMRDFDKPTVAALNGPAVQSGLTLALGCDFRVASTAATLSSGTLRFGFLPDEGGHHLLVEQLGVARTLDLLLRARTLDAATALDWGLLTEVVEHNRLADRAHELAAELAAGPQVAMRLLKTAICRASSASLQESLDDIAVRTALSDHHPDTREGITAFRERRPPQFNGWLREQHDP